MKSPSIIDCASIYLNYLITKNGYVTLLCLNSFILYSPRLLYILVYPLFIGNIMSSHTKNNNTSNSRFSFNNKTVDNSLRGSTSDSKKTTIRFIKSKSKPSSHDPTATNVPNSSQPVHNQKQLSNQDQDD